MANLDYLGRVTPSHLTLEGVSSPVSYDKIALTVDGKGNPISTGFAGYIEVPFDCYIVRVTALADQAGDCVVDIWGGSFASYPLSAADSITGGNPITLSSAESVRDETLTGWTRNFTSGDILGFNVDSASLIERLNLIIVVQRA